MPKEEEVSEESEDSSFQDIQQETALEQLQVEGMSVESREIPQNSEETSSTLTDEPPAEANDGGIESVGTTTLEPTVIGYYKISFYGYHLWQDFLIRYSDGTCSDYRYYDGHQNEIIEKALWENYQNWYERLEEWDGVLPAPYAYYCHYCGKESWDYPSEWEEGSAKCYFCRDCVIKYGCWACHRLEGMSSDQSFVCIVCGKRYHNGCCKNTNNVCVECYEAGLNEKESIFPYIFDVYTAKQGVHVYSSVNGWSGHALFIGQKLTVYGIEAEPTSGTLFYLTTEGWIKASSTSPEYVEPFTFDYPLPFEGTVIQRPSVKTEPNGEELYTLPTGSTVTICGYAENSGIIWYELTDGGWVQANGIGTDTIGPDYNEFSPFHAIVMADQLNVRTEPNGDVVRLAFVDDIFTVYEVSEKDGLTWYRIGLDEWIAARYARIILW